MRKVFLWLAALVAVCAFAGPAAAARHVPGEVLAVFKGEEGTKVMASSLHLGREAFRAASLAAAVGARVEETYAELSEAGNGVFVLLKSDVLSPEALTARLLKREDVLAASPNFIVRASVTEPNDPFYASGALWNLKAIRAPEAWDTTTGRGDVCVAVLDTGIDYTALELAPNFRRDLSRNFYKDGGTSRADPEAYADRNGHGTHVAGTIGAAGNNGRGVTGVNWSVGLISLRTLGPDGSGPVSGIVDALNFLTKRLKVDASLKVAAVNLSFNWFSSMPPTLANQRKDPVWRAFKALDSLNRTVIVTSAGNDGLEVGVPAPADGPKGADGTPAYERGDYVYSSSYRGIHNLIVVGASSQNGSLANFSNWSRNFVDVAAPGVSILSTTIAAYEHSTRVGDGTVMATMNGTSMAAPHVAGAAALLKAADPARTAYQVRTALLHGAAVKSVLVGKVAGERFLDLKGALDYQAAHPELASEAPRTEYDERIKGADGTSSSGGAGCDAAGLAAMGWGLAARLAVVGRRR